MQPMPEELLIVIFSYLRPELTQQIWDGCAKENRILYISLASVARASKQFHRLVTPLLYHTIEIYGSSESIKHPPALSGYAPNLKPLLRTLLQHRDLRPYAKEIKAESWEYEDTWLLNGSQHPVHLMPDLKIQKLCPRVLEELHLPRHLAEELESGIQRGLEDAELAVLLVLVNANVQRLHLTAIASSAGILVPVTTATLLDTPGSFPKLSEFACRNENAPGTELGFSMSNLIPFLRLPALQTLRAWNAYLFGTDEFPKTQSIRSVRLHARDVEDYCIRDMFEAFINLEELEIVVEEDCFDFGILLEQDRVGNVLRKHGGKLEKLVWDVRLLYNNNRQGCLRLGDLRPMTSLRELVVSMRSLLGTPIETFDLHEPWPRLVDILPTSIESLTLLYRKAPTDHSVDQEASEAALATLCAMLIPALHALADDGKFERLKYIELENLTFVPDEAMEALSPEWKHSKREMMIERGGAEEHGHAVLLERT